MKKKLLAVIMSALCLAAAIPSAAVLADGQKVVTLGADLSDEQKQMILRYFGIAGQNIQTLTITNQDERNHLGSYVPLEQIGTRTYSCALVSPTNGGGIQVKTANLSWVTSNMIATTLSTSGVVNCDVLAAAPFEVSGTGALTGILMAYESAVGATLDTTKKEVATQELITTTTIANNIGQVQATDIVNESKMQVIQGNVVNQNDIDVIINEIADEKGVHLTDEDYALLEELMKQIADQKYDYDEMKDTLERVENNLEAIEKENTYGDYVEEEPDETEEAFVPNDSGAADSAAVIDDTNTETEALPDDSILMNTDDSALGDSVIIDATDDAALNETEAPSAPSDEPMFDITTSDSSDGQTNGDEAAQDPDSSVMDEPIDVPVADETDAPADMPAETEAPADGTDVPAEEAPAETELPADDAGISTLQLETIPLSEFVFSPLTADSTSYESVQAGINKLTISFQRDDIVAGNGTLTLYNSADSSVIETIQMNDPSKVVTVPMTAEELAAKGWSSGYKTEVYLTNPLAQFSNYFVMLSQDAFMTADGVGTSEPTQDAFAWPIDTTLFGVSADETVKGITAGTPVNCRVMMDAANGIYAASACITNADESMVSFDQTEFTESGNFTATFQQPGTTTFYVTFYDEAGMELQTAGCTVTVK